jgi:DMSO/TMAO reductase YedYZ molybdopterin-dependent catalytic subunit
MMQNAFKHRMESKKTSKQRWIIAVAVILLASIFIGFVLVNLPRRLYPGEVREYQGENLSSISDVVENAVKGNQNLNQATYRLNVTGLVNETHEYTYSEVVDGFQKYEKVVTIYCVEGWNARILWEGVLVRDLLNASGVMPTAKVVIFHASDGYTTSMPLEYFYDNDILMAYKMNGLVLPPEKGFPFELVAESKLGYKWIKWITQIELSDNVDYRGYWESRGYPNDANAP